jgi:quercetin dioxygenase-like cupin family protein
LAALVLAECVDTDGVYALLEVAAPANTKVPFHHHNTYDEHIEMLEGVMYATIDGVEKRYHPGESFTFPQLVVHEWWAAPSEDLTDSGQQEVSYAAKFRVKI